MYIFDLAISRVFLIDVHKQNGLYSRLFTVPSLIPAKLGECLNKLWFILALCSHKNEELLYRLTGKYMQDVLISVCEEGGMWKRGNTRCRSVPIMGYHLWQKEESRCPVKTISVQIESNSQLAPDFRTPSQPPFQISPSDFINLPKYMTVFFFNYVSWTSPLAEILLIYLSASVCME